MTKVNQKWTWNRNWTTWWIQAKTQRMEKQIPEQKQ